ncbi:MAG: hypothetical protein NWP83_06885, partial [Spirosomaceae bacterium]|nr:hypothetical protein [Spirosomataceae bacterium]
MYVSHFQSLQFRSVYALVWGLICVAQANYLFWIWKLPIGFAFADAFFHNVFFAIIGLAILPIVNYSKLDAPNITNT